MHYETPPKAITIIISHENYNTIDKHTRELAEHCLGGLDELIFHALKISILSVSLKDFGIRENSFHVAQELTFEWDVNEIETEYDHETVMMNNAHCIETLVEDIWPVRSIVVNYLIDQGAYSEDDIDELVEQSIFNNELVFTPINDEEGKLTVEFIY